MKRLQNVEGESHGEQTAITRGDLWLEDMPAHDF